MQAPERRSPRAERDRPARQGSDRRAESPVATPREAQAQPEAVRLDQESTSAATVPDEPMTAAHARLGSEGLARLRARYAATLARITAQVQDAEQQAQLKGLAERLNPDAWVTDAEVSAGLESYEATLEALRGTIGNRRRNAPAETPDTPLV